MKQVAIVVPVFDDWPSAGILLDRIDAVAAQVEDDLTAILVDDGSIKSQSLPEGWNPSHLGRVDVIELQCNLGHQRAIAVGLHVCTQTPGIDAIIVMDSDGEDAPEDIARILRKNHECPDAIIVASRAKRSEGLRFRCFYSAYKLAFRLFTGKTVDFGNFCLLPIDAARRIVHMPEAWNHLAATIIRSRLKIECIKTARASRYSGRSSMNLEGLVTHGFSAISVFSDVVLTRMLIIAAITAAVASATGLTAGALRFFTNLAIPGWATSVVGFSVLLLFQTLSLLAVMIFTSLSNRSSVLFVPAQRAADYVRVVRTVRTRTNRGTS